MIPEAHKAVEILKKYGYEIGLVNPRYMKPMDEELLKSLSGQYPLIVTLEEGILNGGFGSMAARCLMENDYKGKVRSIGIQDQFVEHGSVQELRKMLGIDGEHIAASIRQWIEE